RPSGGHCQGVGKSIESDVEGEGGGRGRPPLLSSMSFHRAIPWRGCFPAGKYQTSGLDKTARNKERVNWGEPFGGGKLKAAGSLVLSQARPCSVVPGPVAKSVMTPGLGGVPRLDDLV